MRGRTRVVVLAVVVVLALGGAGVWWFVLRDDAPPPPELGAACEDAAEGLPAPGSWTLEGGDPEIGYVGYRVDELFGGDTIKKAAVGRTPAISGSLTLEGTSVTAVDVVADLSELASDQGRRDQYIAANGLETEAFPEASFSLTEPISIASAEGGREVQVAATGELTLHGVTQPIEVEVQACHTATGIEVVGNAPIVFADYEIEAPNIGGFVAVDDHGTLELKLRFVPA
jgi:polyisoprenoid-binding protein YceI